MANSKGAADLEIENALKTCNNICQAGCQQMSELWNKMFGKDSQVYKERMEAVKGHLENLFAEMISEETETLNKTEEKIILLMEERRAIENELGLVIKIETKSKLPRYLLMDHIDSCLRKFRDMKSQRMQLLENLKNAEMTLCECLEYEPKYRQVGGVPSENFLNEIRGYLDNLEATMIERYNKFCELRLEVIKCLESLQINAATPFELSVVNTDVTLFKVTDRNMTMLSQLHENLNERIEAEKKSVAEMRETLNSLWNLLEYDKKYREKFLARHSGFGKNTSDALREEIARCQCLKRDNIEVFINRMHIQIAEWWEKCCLSEEQRDVFSEYKLPADSEMLFDAHQKELERLKRYYEENEELISLATRRAELWKQIVVLDNAANQPERLFRNRGGGLLEEEKKRRRIQKQLPLLEKKLSNKVHYYKRRHGEDFLYFGKPLGKLITQQWKDRKLAIEARKLARQVKKSHCSDGVRQTPDNAACRRKGPHSAPTANERGKVTPPKDTRSTQRKSVSSLPNLRKKPQTDNRTSTSSITRQIGLRKKNAQTKPTPVSNLTHTATRSRLSNRVMQRRLLRDRNIPARVKLPITF